MSAECFDQEDRRFMLHLIPDPEKVIILIEVGKTSHLIPKNLFIHRKCKVQDQNIQPIEWICRTKNMLLGKSKTSYFPLLEFDL